MDTPAGTPRLVVPRYGAGTLAELLPSVLAGLGVDGERDALRLGSFERACVLLVDGLGRAQLAAHAADAPFLSSLAERARLTSCAPSTTPTSLTSLGTGLPPARHGIVGFKVRVPGETRLLNHLHWSDRVDPVRWQPEPTAFGRANAAGVAAFAVGPASFRDTGLTIAATRGASYVDAEDWPHRVSATAAALSRVRRGFAYVYWGDLDQVGHVHGVASQRWRDTLRQVDLMAARLAGELPAGSLLWVTADHGMVDVPEPAKIDAESTPGLSDGVLLLGGEPRFRHVYARPGAAADVLAAWAELLRGHAEVLAGEEAVARGWFGGAVHPAVLPRVGDVIAVPFDGSAVVAPVAEPQATGLVGYHGSLTRAEMEVPFLEIRG